MQITSLLEVTGNAFKINMGLLNSDSRIVKTKNYYVIRNVGCARPINANFLLTLMWMGFWMLLEGVRAHNF